MVFVEVLVECQREFRAELLEVLLLAEATTVFLQMFGWGAPAIHSGTGASFARFWRVGIRPKLIS